MADDAYVVWITTRRIKPGTYDEFRRAWRPREVPAGKLRAYGGFRGAPTEGVRGSIWDSAESREEYRLSEVEQERRRAMAPYVENESSGLYAGRELKIPVAL